MEVGLGKFINEDNFNLVTPFVDRGLNLGAMYTYVIFECSLGWIVAESNCLLGRVAGHDLSTWNIKIVCSRLKSFNKFKICIVKTIKLKNVYHCWLLPHHIGCPY